VGTGALVNVNLSPETGASKGNASPGGRDVAQRLDVGRISKASRPYEQAVRGKARRCQEKNFAKELSRDAVDG
jgi:hypothetical protein